MDKLLSQPAVRITFITIIATVILAALKLFFGIMGQSHALTADGVHSISDVFIDVLVLFAAHFGGKKADSNHPYGHGRIETAATFGLALILILAGLGIIANAGEHLWGSTPVPKPELITLWIAILAIFVNEGLFQATLRISKKIKSPLLEANAWHSRSDVAVSIVVVLGIGGALLGFPYLDIIGAVIVGLMIIKLGAQLGWKSISELVDTGVNEKTLEKIKAAINHVPGVATLHQLRTRTINNAIFVDVHILVSPRISVSEGHFIGEQVIVALQKLPEITDITVHVDPEDDEIVHTSVSLPNRDMLLSILKEKWQGLPYADKINDIRLHYLNGKVEVEIVLPHEAKEVAAQYQRIKNDLSYIDTITVTFF